MKFLERGALYLALAMLSACGRQLVEFKPDAGADVPANIDVPTSPPDTQNADVPAADVPRADTGSDAPGADLPRIDAPTVDLPSDLPRIDAPVDLPGADLPRIDAPTVDVRDGGDASVDLPNDLGVDLGLDLNLDRPEAGCAYPATVALGAAAGFAVLAGSTVTNTGLTTVTGDLGVSPLSAVTGFLPDESPGVLVGTRHAGDTAAMQAQASLLIAYDDARDRTLCPILRTGNLGGLTLTPGLYKSATFMEITGSSDLVLDAQGDPNAVFIFQMGTTFMTGSGRQVLLSGLAKASNIFWQVGSSATLGLGSVVHGTIMADQQIALDTGAILDGRALARITAVTLDTNMVSLPAP